MIMAKEGESELAEYAHLAAEAFMEASRSDDPVEAQKHRARAYRYVDLIKQLEQSRKGSSR
jgi:hypothetical protein